MRVYSDVKAAPNKEREIIPAGGYVAKVKAAMVEDTKHGDRLIIYFEVADGDYRGFFQRDYDAQPQEDKKWRGVYRTYLPKEDGSEKDGWSKTTLSGIIWAFEESNPGFHWDWDEAKLKDKTVGVLFRNKEWEMNGNTGWTTQCCKLTDADSIRQGKFKTPKDKPLANQAFSAPGGFSELPNDDDLPWK